MGSNPIACTSFFALPNQVRGCSSLGRAVGSQSAGTGIETLLLQPTFVHLSRSERQWCIGNIEASQALAPGSTPGWRSFLFAPWYRTCAFVPEIQPTAGGVAQMVERPLCMREAQGSIPCSSTLFLVSSLCLHASTPYKSVSGWLRTKVGTSSGR
jgi:hypothetical protein